MCANPGLTVAARASNVHFAPRGCGTPDGGRPRELSDLDEMRNAVTAVGSSAHLIIASAALAAARFPVGEIVHLSIRFAEAN